MDISNDEVALEDFRQRVLDGLIDRTGRYELDDAHISTWIGPYLQDGTPVLHLIMHHRSLPKFHYEYFIQGSVDLDQHDESVVYSKLHCYVNRMVDCLLSNLIGSIMCKQ